MAENDILRGGFFEKHREKISKDGAGGCWLWDAGKSRGYGAVWEGGRDQKAHRVAYEAVHGAGSASGLVVRHRCDVRSCVNPSHLEIGTTADNNRDMMERGRHVAPAGETNGRAALTEQDVLAIRAAYSPGLRGRGQIALANQYGVSRRLVGQIVHRERWKHI